MSHYPPGGDARIRGRDLRREAETLLAAAERAEASQRPPLLDRAAGLFQEIGAHDRALDALGRSIDALLDCERLDAAIALCRRVIRDYPRVVRARCTLTCLLADRGDLGEAVGQLNEYLRRAQLAGVDDIAIDRLRLLANYPFCPEFRDQVRAAVERLGGDGELPRPLTSVSLPGLLRARYPALRGLVSGSVPLATAEADEDLPWLDSSIAPR